MRCGMQAPASMWSVSQTKRPNTKARSPVQQDQQNGAPNTFDRRRVI